MAGSFTKDIEFFDRTTGGSARSGLPSGVSVLIAEKINKLITGIPSKNILDIGTGNGEIGIELGKLSNQYIGFDKSESALVDFKGRTGFNASKLHLIKHDGNLPWPLGDNTINVFFSSRALHLLKIKHAIKEIQRVRMDSPVYIFLGRVERDFNSFKSTLRRTLRTTLKQFNYLPRSGHKERSQLFEELKSSGGEVGVPISVAKWTTYHSPRKYLDAWKNSTGLAGIHMDPAMKSKVLEEVLVEASKMYKDIGKAFESEEWYELSYIKL